MRAWGRVRDPDTGAFIPDPVTGMLWRMVETDPITGDNSAVYLTNLCQVFLLNLNESPFYANYGLPAQQTIMTQVNPNFYVARTQSQFSQFFAALLVSNPPANANEAPVYKISVTTFNGARIIVNVPQ